MADPSPQIRIRVAAIIVEQDSLLLVRHAKDDATYWMLPGGGVDLGETMPEALTRELREEIVVEARIGALLLANDSIAPDHHRHIVNLYFEAEIISGVPKRGIDDRIVEVAFHPIETLHTLAFRPDMAESIQQVLETPPYTFGGYLGNIWRD